LFETGLNLETRRVRPPGTENRERAWCRRKGWGVASPASWLVDWLGTHLPRCHRRWFRSWRLGKQTAGRVPSRRPRLVLELILSTKPTGHGTRLGTLDT